MRWIILALFGLISIVGMAAYPTGISAHNGPIFTNAVLGFADVHGLQAYNASFTSCPYGASLQLNVVLQINTTINTYYYWLQDVAQFATNYSYMRFLDNIWNFTQPCANMSSIIKGKGYLSNFTFRIGNSSINITYYYYPIPFVPYQYPLVFYLFANESYNASGVTVNFGYLVIRNGSELYPPKLVLYDTVFIPVSGIKSAAIIINDSWTGSLNLKDAELVWGGMYGGEYTYFTNMSSFLAMYYNEGNHWNSFNLVYTYGNDTAESADNLYVNVTNGVAYVTTGTPNSASFHVNFVPPFLTYVNISSPVPYYLNGTLLNKSIFMYINEPITIQFVKNYSANSSAFAILNSQPAITVYPSDFMPTSYYITPKYTWYYLVNVNSPVPVNVSVNGHEEQLRPGYYPEGTVIEIPSQTYYYSPTHRFLVSPQTYTINSPTTITVNGVSQYYISVNSSIPVYALINGKNESMVSGWYNAGTNVNVENITYYPTSGERYVIISITPSTFQVNSPLSVIVKTIKQYLLRIHSVN